jgi:Ca2+-binding EF-hand superfamily protein
MNLNGYYLTTFELDLIFERLDRNKDGVITFNEFINELIPRNTSLY